MADKATQTKAKAGRRSTASATSPMPTTKPQLTAWLKDASRTGSELAAAAGKFPETDRLIAAHTLALPATLSTLSHSSDKATRSKVAANPNTPPADYVRLGQQFPNEFLANPALDLLFLENPGLLGELPEALLLRVLKRETCPSDFLVWAAELPAEKIQLAVAMNPAAPAEALDRLRTSAHAKVRESLRSAGSELQGDPEALFLKAVKERLAALTPEEAQEAWVKDDIGLAEFMFLSAQARLRIAGLDESDMPRLVRCALARHPSTPVNLLIEIARDKDSDARGAVAWNANTPVDVLEMLAKDPDDWVRLSVAGNPRTPVSLADSLMTALARRRSQKHSELRRAVACHTQTSTVLLELLARDEDSGVREAVAANPSSPLPVLEVLLSDVFDSVRGAAARNPKIAVPLIEALVKSGCVRVRRGVAANPNTPIALVQALAKHPDWSIRESVAANPKTPVALLEVLAKDGDEDVRRSAAANPNAPLALLEALATDVEARVRCAVAGNPNSPAALLERLASDTEESVRYAVTECPTIPMMLLTRLEPLDQQARIQQVSDVNGSLWIDENVELSEEILAAIGQGDLLFATGMDPNKTVLSRRPLGVVMALCAGPFVEPSRMARVAGSGDWLVRAAIARNSGAPPNIRKKLASDTHPLVRALAVAAEAPSVVAAHKADEVIDFPSRHVHRELASLLHEPAVVWYLERLAYHPSTPLPLLERLSKDSAARVRLGVALNPQTPDSLLCVLARDGGVPYPLEGFRNKETRSLYGLHVESHGVRAGVAKNPNTPAAVLNALAKDSKKWVRQAVAGNPRTPVALLEALSRDSDEDVRCSVAANQKTPVHLLEAFAKDQNSWVRRSVAGAPRTPPAVLEMLSADDDRNVRAPVASNPSTPATVLVVLADDPYLRSTVAGNPGTPVALLERLADSADNYVRRAVAGNANTPAAVLAVLASDDSLPVRAAVAANPKAPPQLCMTLLETLAYSADAAGRRSVARNANAPVALLEVLAKDEVWEVRSALASNPKTPVAVFEDLARDKEWLVRRAVAANLSLPLNPTEVDEAFALLDPEGEPLVGAASLHRWLELLAAFPANPDNKSLTKASRDKRWLSRFGVALHSRASDAMLQLLSDDEDSDVARAAQAKLAERRS